MHSIIALLMPVLLPACARYVGDGILRSEIRHVKPFTAVSNATLLDVTVMVDDSAMQSLSISCDSNLLGYVDTNVSNGLLQIETPSAALLATRTNCSVDITVPRLTAITSAGSGTMFAAGDVDELSGISSSGSGDVAVTAIDAVSLALVSTGSGQMSVSGICNRLELDSSGSGSIDARNLIARDVDATSTGSGNVSFYATGGCEVTLTGSGDIDIYGDPASIEQADTGSGDITVH